MTESLQDSPFPFLSPLSFLLSFLSFLSLLSLLSLPPFNPYCFFLNVPSFLQFLSLLSLDSLQGGRSWQPFGEGKNGRKKICQARIYYFCDKCVVFARNCKFAKLIQYNMQYVMLCYVIMHFLPQKHCF